MAVPVNEVPPRYKSRVFSPLKYVLMWVLNLLQLRCLYECGMSLKWGDISDAWKDCKVIQAVFEHLPQVGGRVWSSKDVEWLMLEGWCRR